MKKVILLLTVILLASCSPSKFNDAVYHEFGNQAHWMVTTPEGTTKEAMIAHAKQLANPTKTTFVYYFDNTVNVSGASAAISQVDLYAYFNPAPMFALTVAPQQEPSEFIYEY